MSILNSWSHMEETSEKFVGILEESKLSRIGCFRGKRRAIFSCLTSNNLFVWSFIIARDAIDDPML